MASGCDVRTMIRPPRIRERPPSGKAETSPVTSTTDSAKPSTWLRAAARRLATHASSRSGVGAELHGEPMAGPHARLIPRCDLERPPKWWVLDEAPGRRLPRGQAVHGSNQHQA